MGQIYGDRSTGYPNGVLRVRTTLLTYLSRCAGAATPIQIQCIAIGKEKPRRILTLGARRGLEVREP